MKRLLSLFLVLAMLLSFSACSSSNRKSDDDDEETTEITSIDIEELMEDIEKLEKKLEDEEDEEKIAELEEELEELEELLEKLNKAPLETLEETTAVETTVTESTAVETTAVETTAAAIVEKPEVVEYADEIIACLSDWYPDTLDPALNSAVDASSYIVHNFVGLMGYDENKQIVPMCAKDYPEVIANPDGTVTYVFELREDLKWSDGTALFADDFVYSWKRAADFYTAADYGYMFDVIDGYYDNDIKVFATDDYTLEVVLTTDVPYFLELCAFPTYMPVKREIVERYGDYWAESAESYIGNGPYKMVEYTSRKLVFEKNEHYFDADSAVTDKLVFEFCDSEYAVDYFKNDKYAFVDGLPTFASKRDFPGEYYVQGQLGTYFINFNVNDPVLEGFTEEEKADIRKALSLIIDRNYICEVLCADGQVPAAGFVAMGHTEPDGSEYIDNNGPAKDGSGYYSIKKKDYEANCLEAIALLEGVAASSGKFTVENGAAYGFPVLSYITNQGSGHEAIASYIKETFAMYGINVVIYVQDWAAFLNTRKNGNYSIARNSWLGDYNDPISFLDMWVSTSGNNDSHLGVGAHANYAGFDGKTWAESYDALITQIKSSKDANERYELMHQAEDLLMSTGAICPIYYYTDPYLMSKDMGGAFSTPLGFKYFMYAYVEQ